MRRSVLGLCLSVALAFPASSQPGGGPLSILVYEQDSVNGVGAIAAQNIDLFGTTIAGFTSFNTLLTTGSYDVVVVDCPGLIPTGGWGPLIDYVNNGGAVVMSYWDWDNSAGASAGLALAFQTFVNTSINLTGQTMFDVGTTGAFLGVTMPHSTWTNNWSDDGDLFVPINGAEGLAHLGNPSLPLLVRGNGGRTIAAPVLDEWPLSPEVVALWENLILMAASASGPSYLVYDNSTFHHLAQQAAFEASPGGTRVAHANDFDYWLSLGGWEGVLVDAPSVVPNAGWAALINYVNAGGNVAMSFWDWSNLAGLGGYPLMDAFEVDSATPYIHLENLLPWYDPQTSYLFDGVVMPPGLWHNHYGDDGDLFKPQGLAKPIGYSLGSPNPIIVYGNGGRTIAAPSIDEAGDTWLASGSGVKLWSNMLSMITTPKASYTLRSGVLGLNPNDFTCVSPPVIGGTLSTLVSTAPTVGTQTLATVVALGFGGPTQGVVAFGYELLILPPFIQQPGFGTHDIPVLSDPSYVGLHIAMQAARVETAGPQAVVVLTNAIDVVQGF